MLTENAIVSLRCDPNDTTNDQPLRPNSVIANTWKVIEEIGYGGFGIILKAQDMISEKLVAIKQQRQEVDSENMSEIYWEVSVMKAFSNSAHCPKLYAYRKDGKYDFLVMELLGPSLKKLTNNVQSKPISAGTVALIIRECLRAIQDLHQCGFVHRDIKPENFALGRGCTDIRTVYLIDYGMCKRFRCKDGTMIGSRRRVGFRGTVTYASANAHREQDLSRKDDLVSLFYMMYEMLTEELPWKKMNDIEEVLKFKEKYPLTVLAENLDYEVGSIAYHICILEYFTQPDYKLLMKWLKEMSTRYRGSAENLQTIFLNAILVEAPNLIKEKVVNVKRPNKWIHILKKWRKNFTGCLS